MVALRRRGAAPPGDEVLRGHRGEQQRELQHSAARELRHHDVTCGRERRVRCGRHRCDAREGIKAQRCL